TAQSNTHANAMHTLFALGSQHFFLLQVTTTTAHGSMRASSRSLLQQQPPPRLGTLYQTSWADCPKVCLGRCANNWKNEMCNDKCNVCCQRCNCVPPGTGQDTRHICPCYDQMTNPHNGKLKCP
uniref:Gibberellin regulated protein n=1 Tax=Aegilops tauschii subsp. strangulata TaxID=200361 RepID=A0A453TDD2_AEGTS